MSWSEVAASAVFIGFGLWLVGRLVLDILGWAVCLIRRISNRRS